MQLTFSMFLIVCPLVFLSGFIDSIAGGGGLISLPAYYLAGLNPVVASGTNKLSAMLGTTVATTTYAKNGRIQWKEAVCALIGALPGSYLGAWLLRIVPLDTARLLVLCALPLVALFVLRSKTNLPPRQLIKDRWTLPACAAIGLVVGVYDGMIGPGTGTFLLLIFLSVIGMEALSASGSAKLVNLGSNVGAFISMALTGNVLYLLALPAAAFAMLGNLLGARLALKHGAKLVRALLIAVLVLMMAKLAYDMLV